MTVTCRCASIAERKIWLVGSDAESKIETDKKSAGAFLYSLYIVTPGYGARKHGRITMAEKKKTFTPANLLILLLLLSVLSLALSTYVTHGNNLETVYYQERGSDYPLENIGMDLYNSMLFAEKENYQTSPAVYSPLNFLIYGFIAKSVPAIQTQTGKDLNGLGSFLNTQESIMTFTYVSIICVMLLIWSLLRLSQRSGWRALLLIVLVLACGPMIFVLERGNGLILSASLIGCFLIWYHDKSPVLREFALICLATSAVLKIYPVVFGLLLLQEKRWGESLRCALYGIFLFFVPFAFFGGFTAIRAYFDTSISSAFTLLGDYNVTGGGTRIDLENMTQMVFRTLHIIGAGTTRLIILTTIVAMPFFTRSNWRRVSAVAALCVLGPSFNNYYAACFYLLPLSLFLLEEDHRVIDYFYSVAFALILCVLPYGTADIISAEVTMAQPMNLTIFACNCGQAVLLLLLLIDFIADVRTAVQKHTRQRLAKTAVPVSV